MYPSASMKDIFDAIEFAEKNCGRRGQEKFIRVGDMTENRFYEVAAEALRAYKDNQR